MSFDQARELAAAQKKPILIDFTGVNCANCRLMERRVLPRPEVVALLKKFVTVQLYTDFVPISSITADQRQKLAEANQERIVELAKEATNPFYVVLSPSGDVLGRIGGYNEPPVFVDFLTKALEKLPAGREGHTGRTTDRCKMSSIASRFRNSSRIDVVCSVFSVRPSISFPDKWALAQASAARARLRRGR